MTLSKKPLWVGLAVGLLLAALGALAFMQAPTAGRPLVEYVPAGPLLVLETRDFASLVGDWNSSREKTLWLGSENYADFSVSRLFLRLKEAQQEFAAAAGFTPDMPMVEAVAGKESVLALYDIGALQFLYVTRLESARSLETAFWQSRANFEPRNAAGKPYFVRVDRQSGRTVGFAVSDDYLLLATGDHLLAGALTLLASGQQARPVSEDGWYRDALQAAERRGELRLTLNLESLVRSPHMRSYWIQRNVSAIGQYSAAAIELQRSGSEISEDRVFLRAAAGAEGREPEKSLGRLLRLAPPEAGLYRAWAKPGAEDVVTLLETKMLSPSPGPAGGPQRAPDVSLGGGRVGHEGALESRIDEAPPANETGTFLRGPLQEQMQRMAIQGMLQVEASRLGPDRVFVGDNLAVVLLGAADWPVPALLEALSASVEGQWTTSRLGAGWVERSAAGQAYYALDGLATLAVAVRGPYLVIANSPDLLSAVLARMSQPDSEREGSYVAGFRHNKERDNYTKIMTHLDFLQGGYDSAPGQQRPPQLFSEDLASLSRTLQRVESASIARLDRGTSVAETVVYALNP